LPNTNGVDDFVLVAGDPGAACARCEVSVVNLETEEARMEVPVAADGSFLLEPLGREGDVLRLETRDGDLRSAPLDVIVVIGRPDALEPAMGCLHVPLRIDLAGARTIEIENACDGSVSIRGLSLRRSAPIVFDGSPRTIERGARSSVAIETSGPGPIEDVLLVSITAPFEERRAISLHAP
jgi:hypothetical protein